MVTVINKYKLYKNKSTSIIRAAEKKTDFNKFEDAKGNLHKTWILLRDVTCNSNCNSSIREIHCNNVTLTDLVAIAKSLTSTLSTLDPTQPAKFLLFRVGPVIT